jgi:hypothetical protein
MRLPAKVFVIERIASLLLSVRKFRSRIVEIERTTLSTPYWAPHIPPANIGASASKTCFTSTTGTPFALAARLHRGRQPDCRAQSSESRLEYVGPRNRGNDRQKLQSSCFRHIPTHGDAIANLAAPPFAYYRAGARRPCERNSSWASPSPAGPFFRADRKNTAIVYVLKLRGGPSCAATESWR